MTLALIPLLMGLGFLCLAVAPLLDTRLVIFDLVSHFPLQAAIGAAGVFALGLPWWKKSSVRWGLVVLFVAMLGNGAWLFPYLTAISETENSGRTDLTIAQLNVQKSNRRFSAVIDWLRRVRPDVFVAVEVDSDWVRVLSTLSGHFPYRVSHPRNDNYGVAVFSRFPIIHRQEIRLPVVPTPAYLLHLDVAGRVVRLAAFHPPPPLSQLLVTARNLSLDVIGQWVVNEPGTATLVVGDLNVTPFAVPFRAFLADSGLSDSRAGRSLFATWPANFPLPARIPIDYILHNRHLRTTALRIGGDVGSDHIPMIGEFSFAR